MVFPGYTADCELNCMSQCFVNYVGFRVLKKSFDDASVVAAVPCAVLLEDESPIERSCLLLVVGTVWCLNL